MDIIVHIRHHTAVYFDAIDMSIQISEEGASFAEDAFALCRFLSQDNPSESLMAFLDDMIELASKAHQSAQSTVDKFRSARRGLFQVIIRLLSHTPDAESTMMSGRR
jgi:hypothetical protein